MLPHARTQVKKFEEAGLDRKPAELLCEHITEVVISNKVKMEEMFVNVQHMSKVRRQRGAHMCKPHGGRH